MVTCDICSKNFSSKSSLDKHMHQHRNTMAFVCEECGQGFPYKSRLLQHQITHSDNARFKCKHASCGKSFKNRGDMNRHEGTHEDMWYYCAHCTYKNKDKRNRDSHARTHEAEGKGFERYHCEKCGKSMRFNTQWRRHLKMGCSLHV